MQKLRVIHPQTPALDTYLHIPEHSIIMLKDITKAENVRKEAKTYVFTVFGIWGVAETAEEIQAGFYLPTA